MKFSFFLSLISSMALAETQTPAGIMQSPLFPMILIFVVIYFMILRPQQKKAKLHQQFLTDLKRGDMVVTNAGIIGMVKNLSEKLVTLEVDDGVCLKFLRNQILESAANLKENTPKDDKK